MLTALFVIMMLLVFGKLLTVSFKMTWGLVKIISCLVFLPIVLIAIAASGLLTIAIPVLAVIGIIALVKPEID